MEWFVTKHQYHAYEIANTLDFNQYSALIVVGGDGTVTETITGMMQRKDQHKLPISLVPNGYSNDLCASLGIQNYDQGLDFLLKRETISVDTVRVLIDSKQENTDNLAPAEKMRSCRYMVAGTQMSMPAKITQASKSVPLCFGQQAINSFYKGLTWQFAEDSYSVEIDGKLVSEDGLNTGLLVVGNGKYINGGAIFNPFCCVNDGLIDVTWVHDHSYSGYWSMSGLMKKASTYGGTQVFDGHSTYMRGKSIKLVQGGSISAVLPITIDNEDMNFSQTLQFDVAEGLR